MNRLCKFSKFSQAEYFIRQKCRKLLIPNFPQTPKSTSQLLAPIQFHREYETHITSDDSTDNARPTWTNMITVFEDKEKYVELSPGNVRETISQLKDEILRQNDCVATVERVLEEAAVDLFRKFDASAVVIELMTQLKDYPLLVIEILNWRRKQYDPAAPVTEEEYSKGITMAGRLNDVDLAIDIFDEASNKKLLSIYSYNTILSICAYHGFGMKCQSIFRDLKADPTCAPSIRTYNILIVAYGNLVLVDHMESILEEMTKLNISPTLNTFNGLIGGYIRAWRWEAMEKTYLFMKGGTIKPDLKTRLLMLRGYAHSVQLEKMEDMYESVKYHVDQKELHLLRYMIRAYCKSSDVDRVEKVEKLLKRIPENERSAWLTVCLIFFYAKENLIERMENWINVAFERKINITTTRSMRCIISSYFRHNADDKLVKFWQRADNAGWKTCRSLFHCKMVMYSSQKRLSEVESVLEEMAKINMPKSKKTFWILYKAYGNCDEKSHREKIAAMMYKCGHGLPPGDFD